MESKNRASPDETVLLEVHMFEITKKQIKLYHPHQAKQCVISINIYLHAMSDKIHTQKK